MTVKCNQVHTILLTHSLFQAFSQFGAQREKQREEKIEQARREEASSRRPFFLIISRAVFLAAPNYLNAWKRLGYLRLIRLRSVPLIFNRIPLARLHSTCLGSAGTRSFHLLRNEEVFDCVWSSVLNL